MNKIHINDLTLIQLDWLVAKCYYTDRRVEFGMMGHAAFAVEIQPGSGDRYTGWMLFHPTTNWEHGGPIIGREGISWHCGNKSSWHAYMYGSTENFNGPTPLIAAMRCYVASKLGYTIKIPDELL